MPTVLNSLVEARLEWELTRGHPAPLVKASPSIRDIERPGFRELPVPTPGQPGLWAEETPQGGLGRHLGALILFSQILGAFCATGLERGFGNIAVEAAIHVRINSFCRW